MFFCLIYFIDFVLLYCIIQINFYFCRVHRASSPEVLLSSVFFWFCMLDGLFIVDDAGDLQFIRPPDHFWDERAPLLVSRLGGRNCNSHNNCNSSSHCHANIILIRSLVLLIRSNVSSDQTATTHQDYDSSETTIVASRCQLNNNNGTSLSN